jgi:hypothetical protein
MSWLQQRAWWGLLAMAVILVLFGITDMIVGAQADPGIPIGLIGLSPSELQSQSAAGYRVFDFFTRTQGLALLVIGALAIGILLFAYRRNQLWAWWAMWALPAWSTAVFLLYLVAGLAPNQPAPPPMISGPILAIVTAAIQLVSLPRFRSLG